MAARVSPVTPLERNLLEAVKSLLAQCEEADLLRCVCVAAARERNTYRCQKQDAAKMLEDKGWSRGIHGKWVSPHNGQSLHVKAALKSEREIARRVLEKALEKVGYWKPGNRFESARIAKAPDISFSDVYVAAT